MESLSSKITMLLVGTVFVNFAGILLARESNKASFQGLCDPAAGVYWSAAYGVSPDGSVVVGEIALVTKDNKIVMGQTEAALWVESKSIHSLGYLLAGHFGSNAYGVSTDGSVVVGRSYSSSSLKAFRWTKSGGMVGLGYPPDVNSYSKTFLKFSSVAHDVSADGLVVVGSVCSTSGKEPFRWTLSGGTQRLGNLPGGYFWGEAHSVSADGTVVVGFGSSKEGIQAFRWTESGGMVGLGDLPSGKFSSEAYALSPDGLVVVGKSTSASGSEAFRWTAREGMKGLGDLPGGRFQSCAYDVSADGSVVVGFADSGTGDDGVEAFIWHAEHGMTSLKKVLTDKFALDLTGWVLEKARGISDDGLTIVGEGINPDGVLKGWIATIPKAVTHSKSPQPIGVYDDYTSEELGKDFSEVGLVDEEEAYDGIPGLEYFKKSR